MNTQVPVRITVFGLGEAGGTIAADLVESGRQLKADAYGGACPMNR